MAQFFKLLFSFAPWLAFMFIAQGSLLRLKIGLVVALVLSIAMGALGLHRGVILWVGLAFFTYATTAVLGFEHMWTVMHMGILAHGTLALGTWYTIVAGKPFTMDYAKDHTPKEMWTQPAFIATNNLITGVWGTVFTLGALIAWLKSTVKIDPEWVYEVANYSLMVGCMAFSTWYPEQLKKRRLATAKETA